MRVISGKFRGQKLVEFKSKHIRPTTDRVKESIFNKLAADLPEARVLDLFAGTGNLAIEALSRGADWVDLVELRSSSLKIIQQNLTKLSLSEKCRVYGKDVFKFLKGRATGEQEAPYDVIFVDPPFTEKLADSVLLAISKSSVYHKDSIIVIEATIHESVREIYSPLYQYDERHFGDKIVFFYSPSDDIENL